MAVRAAATPRPTARAALLSALAAAVLLLVAGCGAPAYTYVTNSADRTYVKLPSTWRQIDQAALDAAAGLDPATSAEERGLWMQGYDADASPSPQHLFGPQSTAPAAFVTVRQVPTSARGQLSLDFLRDLFFPVSPSGRERAAGQMSAFTDFALYTDEVLTPGGGLRGVHTVFRYRIAGGAPQMIDQTAYLNDDASKIFALLVRCSTVCYRDRKQEIEGVVSSFTVRER